MACGCEKNNNPPKNFNKNIGKYSIRIPWTKKYIKDCLKKQKYYFICVVNKKSKKICYNIETPIETPEQLYDLIKTSVFKYKKKKILKNKIIFIFNGEKVCVKIPSYVDSREKLMLFYNITSTQLQADFKTNAKRWNGNLTRQEYVAWLQSNFTQYLIDNNLEGSCVPVSI